MTIKLGSLFDGSGGFPLAATLCGITPVWASEVEPYPIAVTRSRFLGMKHLGDISKINGAEIEPVDVITFGSPCQDLSVAGKRAGLKHEDNGDDETTRSGLFIEAVRIFKEMRQATNGVYPRIVLWENVPGAFSSNKGEDFRIVLQELIQVAEPSAVMPAVPAKGWAYADSYRGDGWSLAYRVFDAQFWGVPQRRRRIFLVADFTGECAGEILFKQDGLRGYFETGRTPWQGTSCNAERGVVADDREGNSIAYAFPLGFRPENVSVYDEVATTIVNGTRPGFCNGVICFEPGIAKRDGKENRFSENICSTLRANMGDNQPAVAYSIENHPADSRVDIDYSGKVQTLTSRMGTGGGNVPMVMEPIPIADQATRFSGKRGDKSDGKGNGLGVGEAGDHMNTLTGGDRHAVAYLVCVASGQANAEIFENKSPTLNCNHEQPIVFDREVYSSSPKSNGGHYIAEGGPVPVLRTGSPPGVAYHYIVRRLTPTECCRLQGFPDNWGIPDKKTELTDDEYSFWKNVCFEFEMMQGKVRLSDSGVYEIWRYVKPDKKNGETFDPYWENTGKEYKPKTRAQMLTWYNKLHTDSAEYKMWGNGIALPPALYCMQGIVDALGGAADG